MRRDEADDTPKTFAIHDASEGFEHSALVWFDATTMTPETPVQVITCWTPPGELSCRCGQFLLRWHQTFDGMSLLTVYHWPMQKGPMHAG